MKSKRSIFRRAICSESLNDFQLCTYNLIIKASIVRENEPVTYGSNNTSHL